METVATDKSPNVEGIKSPIVIAVLMSILKFFRKWLSSDFLSTARAGGFNRNKDKQKNDNFFILTGAPLEVMVAKNCNLTPR